MDAYFICFTGSIVYLAVRDVHLCLRGKLQGMEHLGISSAV